MRRLFVLGLLLVFMYALQFLQVEIDAAIHPKSVATLGFVLLAAFTFGELTSSAGLPKITGYILAGILFGPYVINLFSVSVVDDLSLINSLAIGLIALTAGAEMKLKSLKALSRSLGFLVLIKGFLILVIITITVILIRRWIPFLESQSVLLAMSTGLIFGVLAIGTSPAATIAVINETGSRGRLTDLTLGTAVAKDVVMVVLLAVAISLTRLFSMPDASFDPTVLVVVARELLFSTVAGVIVGGLIIAYIRYVRAEMWLFIIGMIFLFTYISSHLHLEALLLFIVAGFTVQNFSAFGDSFVHPIEDVSLPVYVIFFSIAGAGLNLIVMREVWLIALILVVVRIAAIYLGTGLALKAAKEQEPLRKSAWLSFISQAGVVLGLSIIVENNLPNIGPQIKTIVLGTIGANLLLGPITFKLSLVRVGETESERKKIPDSEAQPEVSIEGARAVATLPAEIRFPSPKFQSEELNAAAFGIRDQLVALQREFEESWVDPQVSRQRAFVSRVRDHFMETSERLLQEMNSASSKRRRNLIPLLRKSRTGFSRWLLSEVAGFSAAENAVSSQDAFESFLQASARLVEDAEGIIIVRQEPERFEVLPSDSVYIRTGKTCKRVIRKVRSFFSEDHVDRVIPFRRLIQYHFAGRLPLMLRKIADLSGSLPLFTLQRMKNLYSQIDENIETVITYLEKHQNDPDDWQNHVPLENMIHDTRHDFQEASHELFQYGKDMQRHMQFALSTVYGEFLSHLETGGTFELPRRRFRYSRVYEESKKARKDLNDFLSYWAKYNTGFAGTFCKHMEVVMLMDRVSRTVDETVYHVLESVDERLLTAIRETKSKCEECKRRLDETLRSSPDPTTLKKVIASLMEEINDYIQENILDQLIHLKDSREMNELIDVILLRFSTIATEMPRSYQVLHEEIEWKDEVERGPSDVKLYVIPLREIARSYLETEIARDLADVNRIMLEQVEGTIDAMAEVRQIINFNLKTTWEEFESQQRDIPLAKQFSTIRDMAVGGITRSITKLDALASKIGNLQTEVYDHMISQVDNRMRDLEDLILQRTTFDIKMHLTQKRALAQTADWLEQIWRILKPLIRKFLRFAPAPHPTANASAVKARSTGRALPDALQNRLQFDSTVMDDLPFIYRKLFDFTPLQASDFLVARNNELRILEAARENWKRGHPSATAVVGELGSGKTSLINTAVKPLTTQYRVYRKSFAQTITSESRLAIELSELLGLTREESLNKLSERLQPVSQGMVIVLEDAHKIFLRTMDGFEALKKLLLLISQTSRQIFWILSIRKSAWDYLDHVLQISDSFQYLVNTENLTRQQLEQVILYRHRVSGFDLRFLPDRETRRSRKYRKSSTEERQTLLRNEFFNSLTGVSEGNILSAIYYWIRSIAGVRENELLVNPLRPLELDILGDMDIEKLLSLSLIIQHGSLTSVEHARIFRVEERTSLSTLTFLANIHLLSQEEENGTPLFIINRFIYLPLAKELKQRRILH